MPHYYYGTVPVLAWIINHYFYGGVHYSWLAERFAPMDVNPKSSNPYLIYGDLYWAWLKRDRYDKFVKDTRRTHADVVESKQKAGLLDNITARGRSGYACPRTTLICTIRSSIVLTWIGLRHLADVVRSRRWRGHRKCS